MRTPRISGTFLDAMACDVASSNWGPRQWQAEFQVMHELGFDTVVLIRAGWRERCLWKTDAYPAVLIPDWDLAKLYLEEAQRYGMKLFFGLYDTNHYWVRNDWLGEVTVNRRFFDEAWARYGGHPALAGWYMVHEVGRHEHHIDQIWRAIIEHIRTSDPDGRILISPRYYGPKWMRKLGKDPAEALSPQNHAFHFDKILDACRGLIDVSAWMDGNCDWADLESYVKVTADLCKRHGVEFWSNLETFERDMPQFYPMETIEWTKLRFKLETAAPYVAKIITFEAPHYLSPNSIHLAARNLYNRYREYLQGSAGSGAEVRP